MLPSNGYEDFWNASSIGAGILDQELMDLGDVLEEENTMLDAENRMKEKQMQRM